jgi:hypothetical protein
VEVGEKWNEAEYWMICPVDNEHDSRDDGVRRFGNGTGKIAGEPVR